jgi:ribosomal protein S2
METIQTLKTFNSLRKSLQDTKVMGRKRQRSRNEKLDRLQRNLTGSQSCRARSDFNYFPSDVLGQGRDMFIG